MKTGELVLTTSIEVRNDIVKPSMRAGFKTAKNHAFLLFNFGTIAHKDEIDERVKIVMDSLGWIPCDDADALRKALADLEALSDG